MSMFREKPPGRRGDVDVRLLLTLQECARACSRRLLVSGPKEAQVLRDSKLRYQCVNGQEVATEQEAAPKRRQGAGYNLLPKQPHSLWPAAQWLALEGEGHVQRETSETTQQTSEWSRCQWMLQCRRGFCCYSL